MLEDLEVQNFLNHLENNGKLERLATSSDNKKAPVHRWFPFFVGFSHNLVKETINYFHINDSCLLFDPFIGSGTTGVVGKELDVNIVGNESNIFLYKICKVKTCSFVDPQKLIIFGNQLLKKASTNWRKADLSNENVLLNKIFPQDNLKKMITIREILKLDYDIPGKFKRFFFLALTMSIPKLSSFSINVPYVTWRCKRKSEETFNAFKKNISIISEDMKKQQFVEKTHAAVKVYLHDSRKQNLQIKNSIADMIFTSPPYLNNLDYGEALKVFLYFWRISKNWNEITKKIRNPSIVSSTTHYHKGDFFKKKSEEILGKQFINRLPAISNEIISKIEHIRKEKERKGTGKSFDILTALYFKDMSKVLDEMKRILKNNGLAFIVIGDSAPCGVHIPTDTLLGEMAIELGFSSYTLKPLRIRGTKWASLRYRHNRELRESLLILRR